MDRTKKYMNPYLAGVLLGIAMIAAYYFSGEGLGSSGAFRNVTLAGANAIAHKHILKSAYFGKFARLGINPLNTWLVFEIFGLMLGGMLSAVFHNRLKLSIGKSPKITNKTRLYAALAGGVLWGIGTQLGRGCTTGLIMSGMAVNSLSGYIGLFAVFGGGYLFAYFVRKLWI
jgi:hypothetical protein